MEQAVAEMFDQARKLVADADRKLAEEEERQREKEREITLMELAGRVEAAFDFTSKEKLELDPRLDVQGGKPILEFVVRSSRMIFVLAPQADGPWKLTVLDDGREPQDLGEFPGGAKSDSGSRRLAAARVVTAIGNWTQKIQPADKKAVQVQQPRWQDGGAPAPERREPTYGTMGKFLGY